MILILHSCCDSHDCVLPCSGAVWAGCIHNNKGNSTVLSCDASGNLKCKGKGQFVHGLRGKAANATDMASWGVKLFVPWMIFPPKFRPLAVRDLKEMGADDEAKSSVPSFSPWPLWRLNFYRCEFCIAVLHGV